MANKREQWGTRFGFIMATAGSAVGLGNMWKYPYMAGSNGGATFTLIYLLCLVLVGLPILLAEFAIGRKTQLNPVGAFKKIMPKSSWKYLGYLCLVSAFIILSFYGLVGGWAIRYMFLSFFGNFQSLAENPSAAQSLFNNFVASNINPIFWQFVFVGLCVLIIVNGVKNGIERCSKIMMPLIFVLLLILCIRGITLDNGMEGVKFLFLPKLSEISASSIVLALGHAFFTLSLGLGIMLTYGSYLQKKQNLLGAGIAVICIDTLIALMSGVVIFTTVFSLGVDPSEGPGLIFTILPTIFPKLPGGHFWGALFFFLFFLAALTSAISILEVVTSYLIDEKKWKRTPATITMGILTAMVGVFCSLSFNDFNDFTLIFGINFFDFLDLITSKYMLPVAGLLTSLFIICGWGTKGFLQEFNQGSNYKIRSELFVKMLFCFSALVVFFILINEISASISGTPLIS